MPTVLRVLLLALATFATAIAATADEAELLAQPGLLSSEFIYDEAPFPSCHAATIVDTPAGLVAAWFGGTHERHPDVGIWVSRHDGRRWSTPVEVANGLVPDDKQRYPTWNPVLFQPTRGPLMLYYKVGPTPQNWWGMVMSSADHGASWSEPRRLPEGILGPIKNKPIELPDGTILSPSSSEDQGWRVHFERSTDGGQTWTSTGPVNDGKAIGAIQPSILRHADGRLQALGRTRSHGIFQVWSSDQGRTWGELTTLPLPNPSAGTDAVTLADGRHLLVYNHSGVYKVRTPLNLAVSRDGMAWESVLVLEDEPGQEFSYPAIIQANDGHVHIVYTWHRTRIKHAVVDPALLVAKPLPAEPVADASPAEN